MTHPWDQWRARVAESGRPDREATELTDEELLNLLATPEDRHLDPERRLLKEEALQRLHRRRGGE